MKNYEINPDLSGMIDKQLPDIIKKSGIDVTCPDCHKSFKAHELSFACPYCGKRFTVKL